MKLKNIDHWPDACWNDVAERLNPFFEGEDQEQAIAQHKEACSVDHS